jgi:hypothetical protein
MFRPALGSTHRPIQWHLGLHLLRGKAAGAVKLAVNLYLMSRIRIQAAILSLPTTSAWNDNELSLGVALNLHKTKTVKIICFSNAGNVKETPLFSKLVWRCNCAVLHHGVQVRKDWMTVQAIWVNISIIDINPSLAQQSRIEKEEEEAVVFDLRCFTSPIHRGGLGLLLSWSEVHRL